MALSAFRSYIVRSKSCVIITKFRAKFESKDKTTYLPNTNGCVGDQNHENNERFDECTDGAFALVVLLEEGQHERDQRGTEQDLDEQIVELLENELPQWFALLGRQFCSNERNVIELIEEEDEDEDEKHAELEVRGTYRWDHISRKTFSLDPRRGPCLRRL